MVLLFSMVQQTVWAWQQSSKALSQDLITCLAGSASDEGDTSSNPLGDPAEEGTPDNQEKQEKDGKEKNEKDEHDLNVYSFFILRSFENRIELPREDNLRKPILTIQVPPPEIA